MDSETRTVHLTDAEIAAARAFFDYGATRGNHEDEGRGPYPGPLSPHVDAMGALVRKALAAAPHDPLYEMPCARCGAVVPLTDVHQCAAPHAAPREGEPEKPVAVYFTVAGADDRGTPPADELLASLGSDTDDVKHDGYRYVALGPKSRAAIRGIVARLASQQAALDAAGEALRQCAHHTHLCAAATVGGGQCICGLRSTLAAIDAARAPHPVCDGEADEHADHGRECIPGGGPDSEDCPCRGTHKQSDCAKAGCGYCRAASPPILKAPC